MATIMWPVLEGGQATGTRVTDVLDGDTVDAVLFEPVAFGDALLRRRRLRLARINAAKSATGAGATATKILRRDLLEIPERNPRLRVAAIHTLKPYKYGGPAGLYKGDVPGGPRDYGGEYLAEIELADGSFVSDLMVEEGCAVYWDGTGPRPADELRGERLW